MQGFVPGLGHSGVRGFKGEGDFVHNLQSPNLPCTGCGNSESQAKVHNIKHPEMGHSDHFIGALHAETFWLPYLWGIEPSEYQTFLDICAEIFAHRDQPNSARLAAAEKRLRETHWSWADGMQYDQFITEQFTAGLKNKGRVLTPVEIQHFVDRAVRLIWEEIEKARDAKRKRSADLKTVESLYPRIATQKAISAMLGRGKGMGPSHELSLTDILATLARKRRDEEAWTLLYERTWPYVLRVNSGVLGNAHGFAEDAAQEVFFRLVRYCSFGEFPSVGSFYAYLRTICWNVSRSYVFQLRRRGETPLSAEIEHDGRFFRIPCEFETQTVHKQIRDTFLGTLLAKDRVLVESLLRGLSVQEIAALTGMTYSNTAVRLHRLKVICNQRHRKDLELSVKNCV